MTTEIYELLQLGSAGAVIVVVMLFLKFLRDDRKSQNEIFRSVLEANNEVLNKVLLQLKADR